MLDPVCDVLLCGITLGAPLCDITLEHDAATAGAADPFRDPALAPSVLLVWPALLSRWSQITFLLPDSPVPLLLRWVKGDVVTAPGGPLLGSVRCEV
jgi:hypothetical protein